jgi:transcriptional regulator with GAF, ATPase, and Fis domain/Tfp pilus assembly protein PilF
MKAEIIGEKYHIVRRLGGGGFSDVYLVRGSGEDCALKLLKGSAENIKRSTLDEFKNEFEILKDMCHPNIAEILDFGFDENLQQYFYTTELIEGRDFYKTTEGMGTDEVIDLFVQALRALEYLHSYRTYHFDIKSANVLVIPGSKPTLKIIDFGLAGIDPRGRLIGTPSYMAPEIVARERADGRADLYSMGVLLYYSLTRKNPFRSGDTKETLLRQSRFTPPAPSTNDATISPWVDKVVMKLLEKNPANRYASAAAVMRDINRLGSKSYPLETPETLMSYIPDEGRYIGRALEIESINLMAERLKGVFGEVAGIYVRGPFGSGKTRFLREIKYGLQLKDIVVESASAKVAGEYEAWSAALQSHLQKGVGLKVFFLDDVEEILDDEIAYGRLMMLLSQMKRASQSSSAIVAVAVGDGVADGIHTSIEQILKNHISMSPLDRSELKDYLISLTGLDEPPVVLTEELHRRTEGNPLFVTELLKSLIAGGGLFDAHGRWKETVFEDVGVDFSRADISETIGGLLLERVKGLGGGEREILNALAVAGRPSTATELARWSGLAGSHLAISKLLGSGLLSRGDGALVEFENALMERVIYDALSVEERARLHDRLAEIFAEMDGERLEILHHISLGSDRALALEAAKTVALEKISEGRGGESIKYLKRAIDISEELGGGDAKLQMKLGEAYLLDHDYESAKEQLSKVEAMLGKSSADSKTSDLNAEVMTRLGSTYIKLQEYDKARTALKSAHRAIKSGGGAALQRIVVDNFLAGILYHEGRLGDAGRIFEKTRAEAAELDQESRARITNNDLGMVLMADGKHEEAIKVLNEDLEHATQVGSDLLIARAHYNLGQHAAMSRDFPLAIESYKRCADVCRESQNVELMLRAYNGIGNAFQLSGDLRGSIEYYDRGLALHERVGDLRGGAAIAINMGILEAQRGDPEAALDRLIPAIEYLRSLPEKGATDWAALSRGLLEAGDILHKRGDDSQAHLQLDESRSIATRVPQASSYLFWILATQADIAKARDRREEFIELVRKLDPLAEDDEAIEMVKGYHKQIKEWKSDGSNSLENSAVSIKSEASGQPDSVWRKILEINKLISGESDLGYVLKSVLFYAMEFTGAEGGAVILADPDGELKLACLKNMKGDDEEVSFSTTLARRVLESGKMVRTDDAGGDERFSSEASVNAGQLRSILCLPVRSRNMTIGVLYLHDRFRVGAFADADVLILDAFADQMGLAIETARLLAASEKKEKDLSEELAEASRRAQRFEELLGESSYEINSDLGLIVGRSAAMKKILGTIRKVADTDLSVFICGESGSGKELVARALHDNSSKRKDERFVAVNCGAIPATLMESELFGYKRGAFTGADRDKRGLIEEANSGTLFLDEIGELAPALQVKLLRVLQEQEYTRIGDTESKKVDVRIVAASNRDIDEMRSDGSFRDDLYYRICQMRVDLPPLRERPEDIAVLVQRFVSEFASDRNLKVHPKFMKKILSYPWPGNVRELRNLVEVSCALVEGDVIDESALPRNHPLAMKRGMDGPATSSRRISRSAKIDDANDYDPEKSWKDYEREIMAKCYAANDYSARATATELGIAPSTMYKRIEELGLTNRNDPIFNSDFIYARGVGLLNYRARIFSAAQIAAEGKASRAIANLAVSQGLFYKVIKKG